MTIADTIEIGKKTLSKLPSPQFEAELLLSYVLKVNRSYLIAFPEKNWKRQQKRSTFHFLIAEKMENPLPTLQVKRSFMAYHLW